MTLPPASSQISLSQVRTELSASGQISLGQATVRLLAGVLSGQIDMNALHGKSAGSAPVITTQPVGYSGTAGDQPSFSVVATGSPAPTYQWYGAGVALTNDGVNWSGVTTATLQNIYAGTAARSVTLYVTVTNSKGSVNSSSVLMTLASGSGYPCPAPDVPLLMADGSEKLAGNILVGDLVTAWDEETQSLTQERVTSVIPAVNHRMKIHLDSGKSGSFAPNHRFLCVGDEWIELQNLSEGIELSMGSRVAAISDDEDGPVMEITVNRVHTYITLGVISHNIKTQ